MYVQQLYTNCLAEAAYYIESNGEAAIVDPIRETEPYVELAKQRGAKIKYVFETHFHADFVSGHIDLANQTGANIVFGPLAETNYKVYNAKDGEEFKLGDITIRAIHTPGHTPESTCYLLLDESYQEHCIFTGDTLFVGDVGRPDLLDGKMSKEELAGMMYDSLHTKIKLLPDEVIVYPAHGPGSSCGKSLGKETWSTIGIQNRTNYALSDMGRDAFIKELCDGLAAPPAYFFSDAMINKNGYHSIESVIKKNLNPLTVEEVAREIKNGALVLDTREGHIFERGFIKGSLNIGLSGMFAIWVGTLVDIKSPIIIVADIGKEEETILRMARVGYENVRGYLKGGFNEWKAAKKPVDSIEGINAPEFAERTKKGVEKILDVRKLDEAEQGHVKGSTNISLQELNKKLDLLNPMEPLLIHCAGGYRSSIASSLLKARGFSRVTNVHGGWSKIKHTDVPVEKGIPANLVTE
jgi:hydroxyacylglutathione hydrolase